MTQFILHSNWDPKGEQRKIIKQLVDKFKAKNCWQTLLGVTGSGKTFVMANVIQALQLPTLVMAPNKTLAAQLYSEFKNFFTDNAVEYFVSYYDYYQPEAYIPQRDIYIEKDASINQRIDQLRMAATSALLSRKDVIIVASVSCIYGLGNPEDYRKMVMPLCRDNECERESLLRKLVAMQYTRNDYDLARGSFRVRGDVIEIWPSYSDQILRLELFADILEQISWCHPVSNDVLQDVHSITIYPGKHYVMPPQKIAAAVTGIESELKEQLPKLKDEGKLLEASRLEARTLYDLEILQEVGYCSGVENYSRYFDNRAPGERPYCLLDYFPHPYLIIVDESHISIPQLRGMYRGDRARKTTLINHGFRLPSALDNRPLTLEEWENLGENLLFVSATPSAYELEKSKQVAELLVRPTGLLDPEIEVYPATNQVAHLISLIKEKSALRQRVLVTTLTKRLAEDLAEFLREEDMAVAYIHCDMDAFERVNVLQDLRKGKYAAVIGINLLREGLDLPEVSLVAILDADREGFLRSETSLIQTMGRAARHECAKVVLYADRTSKAMQAAIDETSRRRQIQLQYNRQHNITPQSVQKEVLESIEVVIEKENAAVVVEKENAAVVAESSASPPGFQSLQALRDEMLAAARELDFEKAAMLRDKIFAVGSKSPGKKGKKRKKKRSR